MTKQLTDRQKTNIQRREHNKLVLENQFKKIIGNQSKLTKKMLVSILKFYQNYTIYHDIPVEKQMKDGTIVTEMKRVPNIIPSYSQLAENIGVTRFTIYNWKDKYPDLFNNIRKYSNRIKEEMVVQFGLSGQFNANFAKFYAINKLGYSDKLTLDTKESNNNAIGQVNIQINQYLNAQGDRLQENTDNTSNSNELPAFETVDMADE